jgi:hypothetical protein
VTATPATAISILIMETSQLSDSPEAVAAKSEGWADGKAKRQPLATILQARHDPFAIVTEYARMWWKLVKRGMREAGASDEELAAADKRAAGWMTVIETYHKELRATQRDGRVARSDRSNLLRDMLAAQEQERRVRFGR